MRPFVSSAFSNALGIIVYELVHLGQVAQAMTDRVDSSGNSFASAIAKSFSVGPDIGLFISIIAAAVALAASLILARYILIRREAVVVPVTVPDPA